MTIEEAIEHCKEVARESRNAALSCARENAYETAISCKACGQEHEQLAEWLTELKQRRDAETTAPLKSNADRIRQMTDEELANILELRDCFGNGYRCPEWDSSCEECTCHEGFLKWLKQEESEDAGSKID